MQPTGGTWPYSRRAVFHGCPAARARRYDGLKDRGEGYPFPIGAAVTIEEAEVGLEVVTGNPAVLSGVQALSIEVADSLGSKEETSCCSALRPGKEAVVS
jgi:hypothetical protein